MNQAVSKLNELVNRVRISAKAYPAMSHEQLMTWIDSALASEPPLLAMHERNDFGLALAHHCFAHNFPPIFMQCLNQLRSVDPRLAQQTAISSWLAMVIAYRAGLSTPAQHEVFAASLFKDIAFSELGYELAHLPSPNETQWDLIRLHPIISTNLVASENYYATPVINAVRLHHERIDGSGYPRGAVGVIPMPAKIVALADQLYRILRLHDCQTYYRIMAYLRINKEALADGIINPTISMLKDSSEHWPEPEIAMDQVVSRIAALRFTITDLGSFQSAEHQLMDGIEHLNYALHQAGLNHPDLLTLCDGEPNVIAEVDALVGEWFWLFKRFIRVLIAIEPEHPDIQRLTMHSKGFWRLDTPKQD